MARYLKIFAIAYAIVLIAVAILSYILEEFFQISLGSATSFASLLGAVIFTAQSYAKTERKIPESAFSWKFATLSTLVAFIVSGVLSIIFEMAARSLWGVSIFAGLSDIPLGFFAIAAIVIGLIYILATRFMFTSFVKSQLKALERVANK